MTDAGQRMLGSVFEREVYALLCRVPRGRVVTYGSLAAAVGRGSARSVGQALRRNPDAPRIPCHRVIGADGRLGGFMGQRDGPAAALKRARLEREGVEFGADGRLLEPGRIIGAADLKLKVDIGLGEVGGA